MPSMTTSGGMFLLEHTINASGDKNIQLSTENTFVDQDILIKINTPTATNFSLDVNNNTTDNVTVGNLNTTTNKYPVTATVGGTLTAGTAGWFSSGSGSETGVQVGLIPKASFTISGNTFSCNSPGYVTSGNLDSITTVTPTASINTGTNNDYNGLSTYFDKLSNSTGANVTIKPMYSTSAGYVAQATDSITTSNITYWKIKTSTVTVPTWSKNNSTNVATMGNYSWTNGYITENHIDAATFQNSAASGVTYVDLSNAITSGGANIIPEIAQNDGYLYINKGYIDNVKISLARLIPGTEGSSALASGHILQGHSAYDLNGNLVTGSISLKAAATYYPSTSDQTIAAGQYLDGVQTIKAVTTSGLTAANIVYNKTVEVGDSADSDRIISVTGTFSATPTGKNPLVAAALRSGYSGFINGTQVDGTMPNATITPAINLPTTSGKTLTSYITTTGASSSSYDVSIVPQYTNTVGYSDAHSSAQSGNTIYYKLISPTFESAGGTISLVVDTTNTTTKHSIYTSNSISYITITDSEPDYSQNKVYIKISSTGQIKTTSNGAGAIKANTTINTTGNKTSYLGLVLYKGAYTIT